MIGLHYLLICYNSNLNSNKYMVGQARVDQTSIYLWIYTNGEYKYANFVLQPLSRQSTLVIRPQTTSHNGNKKPCSHSFRSVVASWVPSWGESRSVVLIMAAQAHTRSFPSSSLVVVFRRSFRSVVIRAHTRSVPSRRDFWNFQNEFYI